jgi:NADH-quinone oxidoreductase subunit L
MSQFAWLIPLFPFLAFGLIILFTRPNHRLSAYIAIGGISLALLVAYGVFFEALSKGAALGQDLLHFAPLTWFNYGLATFSMGWMIDPLAAVMVFMVTTVCLMIFIYSVGYMREQVGEEDGHPIIQDDPRYPIFFAYTSLFAAAMLTLVISSNLLEFFIAWEVMGFCSYALIGFWDVRLPTEHHIDEAQVLRARAASIKAFLTTRVGDVLFMTGMVFLFIITGDLDFKTIFTPDKLNLLTTGQAPVPGMTWLTFIALLMLAGTIAKSAQFPLHIWLPDAMEGPTPVSALIHAATMVAAGVYLIARTYPLFTFATERGGPAMQAVAIVGAFTALFAATLGLGQDDIKRVLAYSTISQLGYMIAALGLGAFVAGSFHLITHAFFKALLFLAAGSVIHGIGTNDMMKMGGLYKKMPITAWTFIVGGLALMGIFPFAGFWSKDEILGDALNKGLTSGGALPLVVWAALLAAAFLTALYTSRQIFLSFFGQPRDQHAHEHAHESPPVMWVPLVILAIFATFIGFWNAPNVYAFFNFVGAGGLFGVQGQMAKEIATAPVFDTQALISALVSLGVALSGIFVGWLLYGWHPLRAGERDPLARLGLVWTLLRNKYYLDELYGYRINLDGSGQAGLLIRFVAWFADFLFTFDKRAVDGLVNLVGWIGRAFSLVDGLIDRYVVDGLVNSVGDVLGEVAGSLRLIQTGRVQNYLLIALLGAAIFALLYVARSLT